MTDATARIKNLSIALEKLHHVDHSWGGFTNRVAALLDDELAKQEKKKDRKPARSAEPFSKDTDSSF